LDENKKVVFVTSLILALVLFSGCREQGSSNEKLQKGGEEETRVAMTEQETILAKEIQEKFNTSTKAKVRSIAIRDGIIEIKILDLGSQSDKGEYETLPIVGVDVAVVLNRNIDKYSFKKVYVVGNEQSFQFTKELFNKYRSGEINDLEFQEQSELQKTR